MLNILERYDLKSLEPGSSQHTHLLIEAMRRALADRAQYLGDPDFVKVPIAGLTSRKYADAVAATIDPDHASTSQAVNYGDPIPYAQAVRSLATSDGNVLLFNCHLSAASAETVLFPATNGALNDRLAKALFEMSSTLPDIFYRSALQEGFPLQAGARGMAFNADLVVLLKFLDMGTRAAVQLR